MKSQKPFTPTRICPHRLCRPLHAIDAIVGIAAIAQMLFNGGLVTLLFVTLLTVIGLAVMRMIHRKTPMELARQDAVGRAIGVQLVVRPAWANIAAGADLMFALASSFTCARLFTSQGDVDVVPAADTAGFVALVVAIGLLAFGEFAHRQATRPARPKRVLVPGAGETA